MLFVDTRKSCCIGRCSECVITRESALFDRLRIREMLCLLWSVLGSPPFESPVPVECVVQRLRYRVERVPRWHSHACVFVQVRATHGLPS